MAKIDESKRKTVENIEAKIDIQQYCKNESLKNKDELKQHLESEYRYKFTKAITIFSLIITLIGIVGTKVINDYIDKKAKDTIDDAIIQSINEYVQPKIDSAFATPNISKLIDSAAKAYTEKTANAYIKNQVAEKFDPFVKQINDNLSKSEQQLSSIAAKNEILSLQMEAMSDSRKAFDQLNQISKRKSDNAIIAKNATKSIIRSLQMFEANIGSYSTDNKFEEATEEERYKLLADSTIAPDNKREYIYALGFFKHKRDDLRRCKEILTLLAPVITGLEKSVV